MVSPKQVGAGGICRNAGAKRGKAEGYSSPDGVATYSTKPAGVVMLLSGVKQARAERRETQYRMCQPPNGVTRRYGEWREAKRSQNLRGGYR